jgi:hypothetical protein
MRNNQVISGVNYSRLLYAPSSFPGDLVSNEEGTNLYYFTSVSSDGDGWPTSLAYGSVVYYCINEMRPGLVSAVLPPSSTDDSSQATFHVLWDGQGVGGSRGWRINYNDTGPGPGNTFEATITDVSAGEAKFTGIDTTTLYSLIFRIDSTDPNDHIRNVRIVHQDYRDSYESEPFLPLMVDYYKSVTTSAGPVRNMKWARTNESYFGILSSVNGNSFELSSTLVPTGTPQAGGGLGMSYAYQIRFANTVERDPWINIHYRADDATVSAIAATVAAELDAGRKLYVELGNEWWNFAFPYNRQITYFTDQAEANGGSSIYYLPKWNDPSRPSSWPPTTYDMSQAYAVQRSIDIFKIFDNYFSADKLIKVLAGQFVAQGRNEGMLLFSGAYNHVDALAVNPYVGSIFGNNETVAEAIETSGWNTDDLFDNMYALVSSTEYISYPGANPQPSIRMSLTNTKNMLDASSEFAGIDIIGYEGGHHLNVAGSITGTTRTFLKDLIASTRYDSRWSDWNQYLCSALAEHGMVTHAHFVDISEWSEDDTNGVWEWFGVIPHLGAQTPTRTGLETYVAGAAPVDPPVDPPLVLDARTQVGYRIDIYTNTNISIIDNNGPLSP